jgi:1,4-beta-D-xylan synthase
MGSLAAGNGTAGHASNGDGAADHALALELNGAGNGHKAGVADQALELETNGAGNGNGHKAVVVTERAAPVLQANGGGKIKKKISPKDKYWVAADDGEVAAAAADGGEDGRRPLLYRNFRVKGILLHPYR